MPYDYTDVDVKCPFFKESNNNINTDDSLVCEGIVYNHTLTILKFQSKKINVNTESFIVVAIIKAVAITKR